MLSLFEQIKNARGTNEKLELAKQFNDTEHEFMEVCFNDVVYGISGKGIEKAINYDESLFGKCEDLGEFIEKLSNEQYYDRFNGHNNLKLSIKQIAEELQKLSGNKQIELFRQILDSSERKDVPWIIRAIQKNMRFGLSLTSYNKVRKAHNLPPIEGFGVQLCGKLEVNRENFEKLSYPRFAEYKYDGVRCLVNIHNENISLIARSGDDITEHYPEIIKFLKQKFKDIHVTFDSEIISKDFVKLSTRMHRKSENIEEEDLDLRIIIFDVIYLNGSLKKLHQVNRRNVLEDLSSRYDLELSYCKLVNNIDELLEFYYEARKINQEGVVTKDLEMLWTEHSRDGWIKMVPKESLDLKIIDCYFGNGKNSKVINGVIVENKDGVIKSKASSGITDEYRKILTDLYNQNQLIGKIAEISFREISKTKNGLSLRFPVFKRLRDDKFEAD